MEYSDFFILLNSRRIFVDEEVDLDRIILDRLIKDNVPHSRTFTSMVDRCFLPSPQNQFEIKNRQMSINQSKHGESHVGKNKSGVTQYDDVPNRSGGQPGRSSFQESKEATFSQGPRNFCNKLSMEGNTSSLDPNTGTFTKASIKHETNGFDNNDQMHGTSSMHANGTLEASCNISNVSDQKLLKSRHQSHKKMSGSHTGDGLNTLLYGGPKYTGTLKEHSLQENLHGQNDQKYFTSSSAHYPSSSLAGVNPSKPHTRGLKSEKLLKLLSTSPSEMRQCSKNPEIQQDTERKKEKQHLIDNNELSGHIQSDDVKTNNFQSTSSFQGEADLTTFKHAGAETMTNNRAEKMTNAVAKIMTNVGVKTMINVDAKTTTHVSAETNRKEHAQKGVSQDTRYHVGPASCKDTNIVISKRPLQREDQSEHGHSSLGTDMCSEAKNVRRTQPVYGDPDELEKIVHSLTQANDIYTEFPFQKQSSGMPEGSTSMTNASGEPNFEMDVNEMRRQILEKSVGYIHLKIVETVKFSKHIPGFRDLEIDDQSTLIRESRTETGLIGGMRSLNHGAKTFTLRDSKQSINFQAMRLVYSEDLLMSKFKLSKKILTLKLSKCEEALLRAIAIISPEKNMI
ncbi:NR1D1-like protein [Mya arenaria]|uniref:NR1D1-like protein n=1 Tax=Mya arenaria TaxID=6604 RepID=A0ABY7F4L6_MYAAR|nr:NR1D1-like protein [Mya arenaria]